MHTEHKSNSRLAFLPISFSSITLGLGGWAIATQKVAEVLALPGWTGIATLALDVLVFAVIALLYAAKALWHADEVRRDLANPIKPSFFPTISIGLILMGIALLELAPQASRVLWVVGTALHLALSLFIIKDWISQEHYEIQRMNPAWFIPVVGNILVPVAGVTHAP